MLTPSTKLHNGRANLIFWVSMALLSILAFFLSYLVAKDYLTAMFVVVTLGLILFFYYRPDLGLYLILFAILPGQLLKIPLRGGSGILLTDILVPLLVVCWLIRKLTKHEKIEGSMIGPPLLIFLSIAFLSFLNGLRFLTPEAIMQTLFYLIRLTSYAFLFFVALNEIKKANRIYNYKKFLIIVFLIFALLGLIQITVFPNLVLLAKEGGLDPHIGRLFATFLDPNFAGAFLTMGLIISLGLIFYTKAIEGKFVLLLVIILSLIGIILTYSRSSYLFLAISFIVLALFRSRILIIIGIAILILAGLLFPRSLDRISAAREIDASARMRFASWEKTLEIARDHPIIGVGYNAYRYAQQRYTFLRESSYDATSGGSDSSILSIIVTTGALGLVAYILFYLAAIKKSVSAFFHSNLAQKRGLALGMVSILVGLIFHSIFVNSLLYPALMIIIFSALGVVATKDS